MSIKPDDIPQDAWDAAEPFYRSYVSGPELTRTVIARAIVAAKAEERDDCEDVAQKIAAAYDDVARGLPADHYKVPYRLHRSNAALEVAQAIRKRGET